MIKNKIVKILLKSIIVIAILNLNSFSSAEDSCSVNNFGSGLPLILQDYSYSEDWFSTLYLNTNKETIPRNAYMEAWVDSGEWGCPPYKWTVDGSGFHFESKSGPTELYDKYNDEIIKLWSDNSACGTATITVTDQCNQTATAFVKSTYGNWVQDCYAVCPDYFGTCGIHDFVEGKNKWKLVYACFGTGCVQICGASASWFTHQGDLAKVWRWAWQCE